MDSLLDNWAISFIPVLIPNKDIKPVIPSKEKWLYIPIEHTIKVNPTSIPIFLLSDFYFYAIYCSFYLSLVELSHYKHLDNLFLFLNY